MASSVSGEHHLLDVAQKILDSDGSGFRNDAHAVDAALRLVIEHLRKMPGVRNT